MIHKNEALYIAHRGEKRLAPENTIAAGRLAVEQGATGLEVDIRLCGSDELVLFHDKTLQRHFGKRNFIFRTPLSQLQQHTFHSDLYTQNDRIPTLSEFLEEFRGTVPLNLDAKTFGSNNNTFVEKLCREIDRLNMKDQVWISAFNPLFLQLLKKQRPDIRIGFLFRNLAFLVRNFDLLFKAEAWHPHHSVISDSFVRLARKKKKMLYVWTVNDPLMVQAFEKYNIEGFITDKLFVKNTFPTPIQK